MSSTRPTAKSKTEMSIFLPPIINSLKNIVAKFWQIVNTINLLFPHLFFVFSFGSVKNLIVKRKSAPDFRPGRGVDDLQKAIFG
jgi:hypothetical protein